MFTYNRSAQVLQVSSPGPENYLHPHHHDPSEVEMRIYYDFNLFNVAVSQIAAVKSDSDWESPDRRAAVSKMLLA